MGRKRPIDLLPAERPDHAGRFHVELRNEFQKHVWDEIWKVENKLIFLEGQAGCGKSFLATAAACKALLDKRTRKFHICRPYVSAYEEYGYLKGDLHEKLAPVLMPIMDIVEQLAHGADRKKIEDALVYEAFGFMRGRTFNSWVIADEAQNCCYEQLLLLCTRIGKGCKIIVTYDATQVDNPRSGILKFIKEVNQVAGVKHIILPPEAQVRETIVNSIIAACRKQIQE